MSSLGPDGTFLDEPATRGPNGATDLSAAPLWAAFRDRYTRAKERPRAAISGERRWIEERSDGCIEFACCA
ncbi:MAG: hypothetical protein ACREFI_12095 [Stellaceae bacterium]